MVIAIFNNKGGAGKTSVAVNLAAALAQRHSVLLVDLDPYTITTWDQLKRLREERPTSRMVGLLGLIRPEDQHLARSEGLARLVAKLTPAAEFLNALGEVAYGTGQGE